MAWALEGIGGDEVGLSQGSRLGIDSENVDSVVEGVRDESVSHVLAEFDIVGAGKFLSSLGKTRQFDSGNGALGPAGFQLEAGHNSIVEGCADE